MSDDRRQVGKIALERKLVPKREAQPVETRGREDDEDRALRTLCEETGFPPIDLRQIAIDLNHLEPVPREVAEALRILPVLVRDDRIVLAMADPRNARAVDELEFVTGKKVHPHVASATVLVRTIAAAYDARSRGEPQYVGPRASVPAAAR